MYGNKRETPCPRLNYFSEENHNTEKFDKVVTCSPSFVFLQFVTCKNVNTHHTHQGTSMIVFHGHTRKQCWESDKRIFDVIWEYTDCCLFNDHSPFYLDYNIF